MVRVRWTGGSCVYRAWTAVVAEYGLLRLTWSTLFYNSLTSWNTVADAVFEPLFWLIDHTVRSLGPGFVVAVIGLSLFLASIFYVIILPELLRESFVAVCVHLVIGHWLLVNAFFHYVMAVTTNPGQPSVNVPEVVSICKVCIAPKPPRSHHCSICNRCVLKMDHHCPWINNCVGHYNHRHFFLFAVFMCIGTCYMIILILPLFLMTVRRMDESTTVAPLPPLEFLKALVLLNDDDTDAAVLRGSVTFELLMSVGVSIALFLLILMHIRLISRGETGLEVYTNMREAQRQQKRHLVYRNPYNFGCRQNWIMFLGLTHGRTFWRHVLLPSTHKPDCDGMRWDTVIAASERSLMQLL